MSDSLKKIAHVEQVSSRATKPDESRKKSLFFLLLAIGRQRALANPTFRETYRSAFNSLEIQKVEDIWQISVNVNGITISQELPRNAFKFYSTGFSEIEDSTVDANKKAANKFWAKIEAEIGIDKDLGNQKKRTSGNKSSYRGLLDITSITLILVVLFYAFAISERLLVGILIALCPILRFFWHSSKRTTSILLYLVATFSFVLALNSTNLNSNQPSALAETAILIFLWVRLYQSEYKSKNYSAAYILQILIIAGYAIYAFFSGPESALSIFTILLIINSESMRYLRRCWIHSTFAVILTIFFEGIVSIVFITLLTDIATKENDLSLAVILLFGSTYLIWFIYLNIFERFPVTFRLSYPILVSFIVLNHNLSLKFSVVTLTTISVSILVSSSTMKREYHDG